MIIQRIKWKLKKKKKKIELESDKKNGCFVKNIEELTDENILRQIKDILNMDGFKCDISDEELLNFYNLLHAEHEQLDNIYITQQSDEKNCFNRMIRASTLENIRKRCSALYNANYSTYSHPTKIILSDDKKTKSYQNDGGGQGTTITVVDMIVNEYDIMCMVKIAKAKIEREIELKIRSSYIDDINKGGSLRNTLIDHTLIKLCGKKYGKEYAPKKSVAAFDDHLELMDEEITDFISEKMKIKIEEKNNYKLLGVWQNAEKLQKTMVKKVNISRNKLKYVDKIQYNLQKYRLLKQVISLDGFILFYQNMVETPRYNGYGDNFIYTKNTMWLKELDKLMLNIVNISTGISWSDDDIKLLGLSTKSGGISLRNLKTLLAPELLSGIHRSIKKIYNLLDSEIIAASNKFIRDKVDVMVRYYNNNTQRKDNITVQEVMHDLYLNENYDLNNINNGNIINICDKIDKHLVENGVKWSEEQKDSMDLIEFVELREEIREYIECIDEKFILKDMKNNMDKFIYYEIYNKSDIKKKARMNSLRSHKAMAFLNIPIGRVNLNEYLLNNHEFSTSLKLRYGKKLEVLRHGARCPQCNLIITDINEHALRCQNGLNSGSVHDASNVYLTDHFSGVYNGVELEQKVDNDDGSRKRPDFIFHDRILWMDGNMEKVICDMVTCDIYSKANLKLIEENRNKIFSAGNIGAKRKEKMYADVRCGKLLRNEYIFTPTSIETFGGVCKVLKFLVNTSIKVKAADKDKIDKESIWINNFALNFCTIKRRIAT